MRVHDAVQVCLQHVQSLKETPKAADPSSGREAEFLPEIA